MAALRVLVLSPGFPTGDRPYYTPGIVDTLSMIARTHELTIHSIRGKPERGRHVYRGLTIVGHGASSRAARAVSFFRGLGKADLVWALWPDRTGLLAAAAARLLGAPLVVSLMGGELADLPELDYGYLRRRRARAILDRVLASARAITAGSERLARRAQAIFPRLSERVVTAPIGVEVARIEPVSQDRWSKGQALRLVAISDLSPVKRVPLLAAAVEVLARRGIDATLDVYGATNDRLFAHGPRVKLEGFIAPAELAKRLPRYHVMVHASAHESQGLALIEAALAGLPIAATRAGVAEELAELGAAIVLVDDASPEALADAALAALERRPGARAKIAARFAVEPCAARFARIFEEAARG
jgi:glycosyltransferase involved in cell wall biosynthesis